MRCAQISNCIFQSTFSGAESEGPHRPREADTVLAVYAGILINLLINRVIHPFPVISCCSPISLSYSNIAQPYICPWRESLVPFTVHCSAMLCSALACCVETLIAVQSCAMMYNLLRYIPNLITVAITCHFLAQIMLQQLFTYPLLPKINDLTHIFKRPCIQH